MVRMPDSEGSLRGRCGAIVQTPDLMPTILELAEAPCPETVQGKSMLPLIKGKEPPESRTAISSPSLVGRMLPSWITVTSEVGALLAARIDPSPRIESELYNLSGDPSETKNLYGEEDDVAEQLHSEMVKRLGSMGAEDEILSHWTEKTKTED